jgi:hypothetical protein
VSISVKSPTHVSRGAALETRAKTCWQQLTVRVCGKSLHTGRLRDSHRRSHAGGYRVSPNKPQRRCNGCAVHSIIPSLNETTADMHDCRQASEPTKPILFLSGRLQRAGFCRRRCSLAFIISFMSPLAESRKRFRTQRRMLRHELCSMIHVPRLKDENAAELFFGFRIGTVRSCDFAVLPIQGQGGFRRLKRFSTSPMPVGAKMVVVFKACVNIACCSPSVMPSRLPFEVSQTDVFHCSSPPGGTSSTALRAGSFIL